MPHKIKSEPILYVIGQEKEENHLIAGDNHYKEYTNTMDDIEIEN